MVAGTGTTEKLGSVSMLQDRMGFTDRLEPGVLRFDIEYPEQGLSRLLIFVKWLLLIPQFILLYIVGFLTGIVGFVAWFAILITGRYPRGMWDFVVMAQAWSANVFTYYLLMRDEYPPLGEGEYPVHFDLVYPPRLSRGLIFVKWLLVVPHLFVLSFIGIAAFVVYVLSWFAILITGQYPRGMFRFMTGVMRWSLRVNIYNALLTDRYPPFSLD
jgi:hypothetical protein